MDTDSDSFDCLLECNGLTVGSDFSVVTSLEVFQQPNYRRLVGLDRFVNLQSLEIMHQPIEDIRPIASVKGLRMLRLAGNSIKSLRGIESLAMLEELYVNENSLTTLNGIANLKQLRILVAYENAIDSLGDAELPLLETLHIANNRLNMAALTALSRMPRLRSLNLSGNLLSDFRVFDFLRPLRCLSDLALADPHFAPCKVTRLAHYHTLALAALPSLTTLDCLRVDSSAAQSAQRLLQQKAIFYQMRSKSVKRRLKELPQRLIQLARRAADRVTQRRIHLTRLIGGCQRELDWIGLRGLTESEMSERLNSIKHKS